ncbi:unnamed protein product [Amoebophrya sp. A25]|nr:unnamed protein product [Amoebophrya sp. A25]|eukprot:GSA25T00007297001.1
MTRPEQVTPTEEASEADTAAAKSDEQSSTFLTIDHDDRPRKILARTDSKETTGSNRSESARLRARRLAVLFTDPQDRESMDLELKRLLERARASPDVHPFAKTQDKLTFVLSVMLCFFAASALTASFMPSATKVDTEWGRVRIFSQYVYPAILVILVPLRFYLYRKRKYQYFCLDYCYFSNYVLVLWLWVFPDVPELFSIAFAAAAGPLAGATWLFRNSLVFHSLDKMTSCYIHLAPLLVVFEMRHSSADLDSDIEYTFPKTFTVGDAVGYGGLFYLGHLALYTLILNLPVALGGLPEDPAYLTSFRYLVLTPPKASKADTSNKAGTSLNGGASKLDRVDEEEGAAGMGMPTVKKEWAMLPGGPKFALFWYTAFNMVAVCAWYVFTPVFYHSFVGMLVVVVFWFTLATWNGANFYIEVFSRGAKLKLPLASTSPTKDGVAVERAA